MIPRGVSSCRVISPSIGGKKAARAAAQEAQERPEPMQVVSRPTSMKRAAALLMLIAAACGQNADASRTRAALSELADGGLDREPVLTITPVCYDICPSTWAVPAFAIYRDGTLVTIDRVREGVADLPHRMRAHDLSDDDLDHLAYLMEEGGLNKGDVHAEGTREGVADGGGTIFETLIGSTRTYVHAPLLGGSDETVPARQALNALLTELRLFLEDTDFRELPMAWVMLGEENSLNPGMTWSEAGSPSGDPACLAFDAGALSEEFGELVSQAHYESTWISFDNVTYRMTGRPLLPHENGCEDVQASFNRMLANDSTFDLGGAG